ncbi:unnamed protein product [Leptosia nina]|uniref:Uncharacterized protein n=1 Tax=Leptosia nina TaxID=320188 RepID=A0AAV1JM63_9NEOP
MVHINEWRYARSTRGCVSADGGLRDHTRRPRDRCVTQRAGSPRPAPLAVRNLSPSVSSQKTSISCGCCGGRWCGVHASGIRGAWCQCKRRLAVRLYPLGPGGSRSLPAPAAGRPRPDVNANDLDSTNRYTSLYNLVIIM